jgi:hypothetical protein
VQSPRIVLRISALAFLAFTAGLVYVTYGEVRALTRELPPTPAEVTQDVVVRNVRDADVRRASFRILLFTDEFRWRINSFDTLEGDSGRPSCTPEMKGVLNSAPSLVGGSPEFLAALGFEEPQQKLEKSGDPSESVYR